MSTLLLSPRSNRSNISSKLLASVSRPSRPHRVPPPRLVPLTRSNFPDSSILRILTPEPILTSKQGSLGVGSLSNRGSYIGGVGLGRGRLASWLGRTLESPRRILSDNFGCRLYRSSTRSSENQNTSSGINVIKLRPVMRHPISSSRCTSTPSSSLKR